MQVIMRAVECPSRWYSILKKIESIIMFFCSQQLTSTPKKETIRISFCNHHVTSTPRQTKDLNEQKCVSTTVIGLHTLICFWWRHPRKEYETKTIRKGFGKCYSIPLSPLWRHASVSFTAHNMTIARMIHSCTLLTIQGAQNWHAVDKTSVLDMKK